jgi:hypothetical protein
MGWWLKVYLLLEFFRSTPKSERATHSLHPITGLSILRMALLEAVNQVVLQPAAKLCPING